MYSSSNFENDFKQSEYVPARTKRLTKKKVKEGKNNNHQLNSEENNPINLELYIYLILLDRLTGPQLYIIITQITEIFQYFGNILKNLHEKFELLDNKVNQLTDIIDDYSRKYAVLPILENSRENEEQQFDGSNDNSQNSSSSKSVLKSNKVHIDDDMNTSTEIVEKSMDESMLTDRDANLAVEQKLYNSFPAPLHIERVSTATSFCCPICRKCVSSKKSLKVTINCYHQTTSTQKVCMLLFLFNYLFAFQI